LAPLARHGAVLVEKQALRPFLLATTVEACMVLVPLNSPSKLTIDHDHSREHNRLLLHWLLFAPLFLLKDILASFSSRKLYG
jgi:hypothetical protein